MNKKKKIIIISCVIITILIVVGVVIWLINKKTTDSKITKPDVEVSKLKELPKPEITGGQRGELGIDKNINESTIDEYLGREDSIYRDMRMLEDPGNYEAIGGDRYLSGYVEGFEVIPLPYIIPVTGLPNEVGDTYTGTTLFYDDNGTYVANYKESMDIIEEIFPKDKVIFLMCGGGGYSGMTKNFLVSMGWDENKIYNTGGYWFYNGKHNIDVKKEKNGVVSYDFDKVPYHKIDFDELTKSKDYKAPKVKVTEIKINTSNIELEEGASFQLNAIVLPNNATNKNVFWSSDDETVATVENDGLVKAVGAGSATITVESIEGNKIATCDVTVNKKIISTHVKLDDLSEEANKFSIYSLKSVQEEFSYIEDEVKNHDPNPKYHDLTENGGYINNDLGREENKKKKAKEEQVKEIRLEIFNRLVENKKSFIILMDSKNCEDKPYNVLEGTEKILKQNNYSYFHVGSALTDGEETLQNSKLDCSNLNGGSVAIVKDGKIYASIDPDVDAIKNDEELKNWLSKYIDIG